MYHMRIIIHNAKKLWGGYGILHISSPKTEAGRHAKSETGKVNI